MFTTEIEANDVGLLLRELAQIKAMLASLIDEREAQKTRKAWHTTDEAATLLDRRAYTVREWCRQGRIRASKRQCGAGGQLEWTVSAEEIERIRNHGLLPLPKRPGEG